MLSMLSSSSSSFSPLHEEPEPLELSESWTLLLCSVLLLLLLLLPQLLLSMFSLCLSFFFLCVCVCVCVCDRQKHNGCTRPFHHPLCALSFSHSLFFSLFVVRLTLDASGWRLQSCNTFTYCACTPCTDISIVLYTYSPRQQPCKAARLDCNYNVLFTCDILVRSAVSKA